MQLLSLIAAYLFSYFVGQADGLHLAYSRDGYQWTPIAEGQSLLVPQVGDDRLMRDPSICQGPDGIFHLVWTSSWTDRIIGHARTTASTAPRHGISRLSRPRACTSIRASAPSTPPW